jgi:type II secretory pathway pseudopilin PulG
MKRFFPYFQKDGVKGITILEIIVVVGILLILTTVSVSNLSSYRSRQILNGESSQILSILNKARYQTLASKAQTSYGVRIESDRVTLYTGPTFASVPGEYEEYVLNPSVSITNISLNGGSADVLFERLTGETVSYGTFQVTLLSEVLQNHIIEISQTGFVGIQE